MLSQLLNAQWQDVTAAVGLALVIAWLLSQATARLARVVLVRASGDDQPTDFRSPLVRRPIRVVQATVFAVVFFLIIFPALELAGVESAVGIQPRALFGWLVESGTRMALIVILAYTIIRAVSVLVTRFEAQVGQGEGADVIERAKRARTLSRLLHHAVAVFVFGIAGLMILQQLQIDIMPVLTGAGIVGLAIGFGAQTLVRDIIGGFFLILENQVRVGDVAVVNGTGGLVEGINLRTIVLRDLTGQVHIFPNGAIERLSNLTKDFSFFVLDMGIAYKEDTDRVVEVLREVAADLQTDPKFAASILEPLEVLGVDAFGDSAVVVKVRFKTLPIHQWNVGREFRRRIKKAFDAQGIEIPFPHRSIYFGEASKPWVVRHADGRRSDEPAPANGNDARAPGQ